MSALKTAAPSSFEGALQLSDLGYRLPAGKDLIQNISFALQAGERLAIVGPNGAGKSTLLRLLAGLLQPSDGLLRIDGQDSRRITDLQRAQMLAFLPQHLSAERRMTVNDFVALGCLPHAREWSAQQQHAQVDHCLSICLLHKLKHQPLGQLSGGELQRANLARTLVQKPALLLLDEPTNHLDSKSSIELLSTVASMAITCVAVLHDLSFVPHWATHVLVMRAGAMVSFGAPEEVLTPQRVEHVFSTPAFYLPHPTSRAPMLVMDRSGSGPTQPLTSPV